MEKVKTGSQTGESLRDEVILNICNVKKVPHCASNTIINRINDIRRTMDVTPEEEAVRQYKILHSELQVSFS